MTGDIDLTVRALVASLEAPPDPATHKELSPVLSVLTVLLSLDKRKPGYVEERIQRLQSPDPGYNTLVGIRSVVGSPDDACLTSEQYFRMDPRDDGKRAAARARVSSTRIPGSGVSVFAVHRHFISWRLESPPGGSMPRPIFSLLAELQSTLAELADALNPLQKLASTFRGHDGPFPMKPAGKKRATRKRRAASLAPTKATRKPARKSRGTSARLALQGKYMSALRKLSKADQAEVKKVRSEQGVEAALKVAAAKAS